ncbi:MAG: bifunctional diguanylate cyclase/phosphodiesterase, partial [Mycobacterium sp.]|nr:bifunctional diguanylate cyclase/phosphodiesterase [Mycobacterium sp.]
MTPSAPKVSHVAVMAAVVLVAYAGWLYGDWSHDTTSKVIADLALVAVSLVALIFTVMAACAAQGALRGAWWALVGGLAAWNAGEILWTYDEVVLHEIPFPSAADAFFLAFPVGACVALVLFWNRHRRRLRGLVLLDGLIVAGSFFIASWSLVMADLYAAGAATRVEFILSLAYPVSDLVVVTIAAVVLVSAHTNQRLMMTLLTVGLISMSVADTGYAYLSAQREYSSGSQVDIFWIAGLLLLTVAAAVSLQKPPEEYVEDDLPGWALVWLPYAPLMFAAGVLAVRPPSSPAPVIVVGVLLVVLVLARQFIAVSEDRRLLAAVAEQSLHDPLTGLANRVLFQDRLNHAMQLRSRDDQSLSVLAVDLDDFKLVNDTLGHAAGDELLIAVAGRLRDAVRTGDTVSRLGGDEFGVILEGPAETAEPIARRVVAAFDAPFTVEGHELVVQPSVGLAVAQTTGTNPDRTVADLLKRADMAMYAAKRSRGGGEQSRLWSSAEEVSAERDLAISVESVQLLDELRHAIDRRELVLVYQPKFSLKDSTMVGVEALLRWPRSEGGLLGPDDFLPLVRRHGLIGPVTDFVLTQALDDAARWYAAGVQVPVAINLFPPSLATPNLPERISRELDARGLSPSALTVEITEDMALDDTARTRNVLSDLRDCGILVAIDDFGSGYSALTYLRDLPVDEVKLDRDFIAPIAHDPRAAAVARAVIDVAHVLCLTTVAEGVENIETVNSLRQLGCDHVQGYFYSPPLTAEQVLDSLERRVVGVGAELVVASPFGGDGTGAVGGPRGLAQGHLGGSLATSGLGVGGGRCAGGGP